LLGALNDKGSMTELGVNMSKLPLSPIYSKTLLVSQVIK
jgi:HrpA-like RNA helicase